MRFGIMVYLSRHVDEETRRRDPEGRVTDRKGRAGEKGNLKESSAGPHSGNRRWIGGRRNGRGSFGIVERSDGRQTARFAAFSATGGTAVFGPHPPTASADGVTASELGPRPDEDGTKSPERVEASAKAPSGFLASGGCSAPVLERQRMDV